MIYCPITFIDTINTSNQISRAVESRTVTDSRDCDFRLPSGNKPENANGSLSDSHFALAE